MLGQGADVLAEQFVTNATGEIVVRPAGGLFVTATAATLGGNATVLSSATLSFSGDMTNDGTLTGLTSASLVVEGTLINAASGVMTLLGGSTVLAGAVVNSGTMQLDTVDVVADSIQNQAGGVVLVEGDLFAPVTNDGQLTCIGDTLAVGDYTNNVGATTTVQIGTLTIIGPLIKNGTIIGDVVTTLVGGTQPGDGLNITGDYVAGAGALLVMPDPVWRLTVGGNYDVAVDNNPNYHMVQAQLRMAGSVQALEIMSTDIGPDPDGLDRTLPGHYPIRQLRIGPGLTTVNVVDNHDNDGLGQVLCEAIYVQDLIIESGATLNTLGCKVYYSTLTLAGAVDNPANLIEIVVVPPCPTDTNNDGVTNVLDLIALLLCFGQPDTPPCDTGQDVNGDGNVNVLDLIELLLAFGQACP